MKTTIPYVTKHQLRADYVTKFDFSEFRQEVKDRFDVIESRLSAHDKRFDVLERKIDAIEENIKKQVSGALDEFTHRMKLGFEYIAGMMPKTSTTSKPFPF